MVFVTYWACIQMPLTCLLLVNPPADGHAEVTPTGSLRGGFDAQARMEHWGVCARRQTASNHAYTTAQALPPTCSLTPTCAAACLRALQRRTQLGPMRYGRTMPDDPILCHIPRTTQPARSTAPNPDRKRHAARRVPLHAPPTPRHAYPGYTTTGNTMRRVATEDVDRARRIWPITSVRVVGWEKNGSPQPSRMDPRAAGGMGV